jgi:hypothetical protein
MNEKIIKTTDKEWFSSLALSYKDRLPVLLIDDAKYGINPEQMSLFQIGRQAKLPPQEWTAVGVSLGISVVGMAMIVAAVFDPEPTSKLGILLVGGAVCILGGGFSAIKILTKEKPPNIELGSNGIKISWE